MWNIYGRGEVHTRFCLGNLRESKEPRHRWEDNIKMDIQEIRRVAPVSGLDGSGLTFRNLASHI